MARSHLLRTAILGSEEKLRTVYHNAMQRKLALRALRNIEQDTGYILRAKERRLIKSYAKEMFGSHSYAYWLYVYAAYQQRFVEGWIPNNYFGLVVAPRVNHQVRFIAGFKTLSKRLFETNLFPDIFYVIDNKWYDYKMNPIEKQDVRRYLIETGNDCFAKAEFSGQGKGVVRLNSQNFDDIDFKKLGTCVIQESIRQAKWFEEILRDSVATIRITTVKEPNGTFVMRAAYLRVGRSGSDIVQSSNAIRIPIIDRNGALGDFGADPDWRRHYKHPDSGFVFSGKTIPYFDCAVSVCERLHGRLPHCGIIGWDVAITNSGETKIMEWNARHPDITFSEASTGPNFRSLGWEKMHYQSKIGSA